MRAATLGNGRLSLGLDKDLRLREMFWPSVGLLNHLQENGDNNLLLWRSGSFDSVGGAGWETRGAYGSGMSFRWETQRRDGSLNAVVTDCVDPYLPVWARTVEVLTGPGNAPPEEALALYSMQAYALGESTIGEGAAWDPVKRRLYHFKGAFWVAIQLSGTAEQAALDGENRVAVAKVRDGGVRFLQDSGEVEGPLVDHGFIQSALGLRWASTRRVRAEYLLAFGADRSGADSNLDMACNASLVLSRSERYWSGVESEARLSVAVLASHADYGGGIVAACDTDIQGDYRDHYRYVWPRDAAMCVSALLRTGLPAYARRYLGFCSRAISKAGFFWQRYRVDGTQASGWHPWTLGGGDLPIQEDETALSLMTAGDYLRIAGDLDSLNDAYLPFVKRAASFILDYTQADGMLVRPSYDLWEERRGVFAFTQAACAGGLLAAAEVASALGYEADSRGFERGVALLLSGLQQYLSNEDRGFCRGIAGFSRARSDIEMDWTDDASLFMIPLVIPPPGGAALSFGPSNAALLETIRRRSKITWTRLKRSLAVVLPGTDTAGYARYRGDWYWRPDGARDLPGNPWLVTTAWYVLAGLRLGELGAKDLELYVKWFCGVATDSGLLPEQLDCIRGEPRSVSPLAWSHAMYLDLLSSARTANTPGAAGKE